MWLKYLDKEALEYLSTVSVWKFVFLQWTSYSKKPQATNLKVDYFPPIVQPYFRSEYNDTPWSSKRNSKSLPCYCTEIPTNPMC